jgi:glycosyltransferase involved in cell wall biosynthesis
MKRKLLFIIPSLTSGGAEKSLVNLLNSFDYSKYDVDLALLSRKGIFLEMIPEHVNILDMPHHFKIFSGGLASSILGFLMRLQFGLVYHRLVFALKNRTIKNSNQAEQLSWKHMQKSIGMLDKEYDAAIGYLEKTSIYFCVDCAKAKKKIGFVRTDYSKLGLDAGFDEKYFSKLDYLCANGYGSQKILQDVFPKLQDKIRMVMNVVSEKLIRNLGDVRIESQKGEITLLSIGRLDKVKGFDLSIGAATILKNKNLDFRWLIIGEGPERGDLERQINDSGLTGRVVLLGEKSNPYPYLKACDLYVQTSRFEGRSSTINEAKIMNKPIVVTDFDSVFEQIENKVNGLIVEKTPESIAEGIKIILENTGLKAKLIENLSKESLGTENEISKFYELIE